MTAAVVFGGGAVGAWMSSILSASGYAVTIIDKKRIAHPLVGDTLIESIEGDLTAPSEAVLRVLSAADMIIMAVPEASALDGIEAVVGAASPASLIVETLTVKTRFAEAFDTLGRKQPVVGINPLFRPDIRHRSGAVAIVDHAGCGDGGLCRMLTSAGCSVHGLDATQHDRSMAVMQCLTHAAILSFGVALRDPRVEGLRCDGETTPPFAGLSALLVRILTGEPHVYWEIQRENPFAAEARRALAEGVAALDRYACENDFEGFAALFADLQTSKISDLNQGARRCEAMFAALPVSNPFSILD